MSERESDRVQAYRTRVLLGIAGAACLFAHRDLFGYDPGAGVQGSTGDAEDFFFSPTGGSPVLIFGLAAWMLFARKDLLLSAIARNDARRGLAALLLVPASLLHLWSYYIEAPDLLVVSLIPMILGCGLYAGGTRGLRVLALPACFLIFAVPIPAVLINQVIWPLQQFTAQTTTGILNLFGAGARLSGDQVRLGPQLFQVIETCSGWRSVETLTMASVLYAELFYRSRLHAFLIVASAPIISLIMNHVRVLSIMLNPYSEIAGVHTTQGVVTLVGGVLMIAVFDWMLSGVFPEKPAPARSATGTRRTRRADWPALAQGPLLALIAVMGALGVTTYVVPRWSPPSDPALSSIDLPLGFRGYDVEVLPVDGQFLGSTRFSKRINRRYTNEESGESFEIFVGVDDHLRRESSLLSPKTILPGSGWQIVDEEEPSDLGDLYLVQWGSERRLVLHFRHGVESLGIEFVRSALGLDRSPFRRPGRATVVRLSARVADASQVPEVRARLLDEARSVREILIPPDVAARVRGREHAGHGNRG